MLQFWACSCDLARVRRWGWVYFACLLIRGRTISHSGLHQPSPASRKLMDCNFVDASKHPTETSFDVLSKAPFLNLPCISALHILKPIHCSEMSRQGSGSSAPRSLTLTEELEKLEQSITLTLQGMLSSHANKFVDSNFGKARLADRNSRNRSQLQQGSPHRHDKYSATC